MKALRSSGRVARAILVALAVSGCVAGIDTLPCSGLCTTTGTIQTQMTDAPFPFDSVKSVVVFVVQVDVASATGWTLIAKPNRSFDLLKLQNGTTTTLGKAVLDTGSYVALRLVLDTERSSITLKDGKVLTGNSSPGILWRTSGNDSIEVSLADTTVRVGLGSESTLRIHFNVDQTFVLVGSTISSGGVRFEPHLTASMIK